MQKIKIMTDSASDLSPDAAKESDIEVVPLTVRFGEKEFVDRQDLTPEEFWVRLKESTALPQTAAPSPGAFEAAYRRAAQEGHEEVISIHISSKLSATLDSARLAADAVEDQIKVHVFDSLAVTANLGTMATVAAEMAKDNKSAPEIIENCEKVKKNMRLFVALGTLEYLKKGGRIGGAQAFLGTLLSIKPIITVREGKVEPESKQRTRTKSLQYLADKVKEAGAIDNLCVMQGAAPDVGELVDLVAAHHPRNEIKIGETGPVIGTHTGPEVLAVSFTVAD